MCAMWSRPQHNPSKTQKTKVYCFHRLNAYKEWFIRLTPAVIQPGHPSLFICFYTMNQSDRSCWEYKISNCLVLGFASRTSAPEMLLFVLLNPLCPGSFSTLFCCTVALSKCICPSHYYLLPLTKGPFTVCKSVHLWRLSAANFFDLFVHWCV